MARVGTFWIVFGAYLAGLLLLGELAARLKVSLGAGAWLRPRTAG